MDKKGPHSTEHEGSSQCSQNPVLGTVSRPTPCTPFVRRRRVSVTPDRASTPRLLVLLLFHYLEPGWRSRHRDWQRTEGPRIRSSCPGRGEIYILSTSSIPVLRSTHPPIQRVLEAVSLRVKRPGREADHSPTTSAEIKKMWIYTSTPPYVFMA
jgi:hypothetical protein